MSDKFQTNIDLQGNAIEKGSFERFTTPPTEDNFLGRQIELNGVPHFYNGNEFESFWRRKKANAENEAYVLLPDATEDFINLYESIFEKYGNVNSSREIRITLKSSCYISLYGSWPKNVRYNLFLWIRTDETINVTVGDCYSVNGLGNSIDYTFDKQCILYSSFINLIGLGNPFWSGIPLKDHSNLFWRLVKANPEVSTALFKPLNTDTGVFAHLYADSRLDESRDIIVDFSTYAGGRVFTDFFSAYNLDNNNHPYSWTETNENSEKMKYVRYKMLLCNNPYTYPIAICVPDNPNIITNFSEVMTGLTYPNEQQGRFFYLYPNQSVNVDFELIYLRGAAQPILAVININSFTGTATFDAQRTSSTENGTVISNYLTSNNIPCTVDKNTGQTLYNVQDLLANIITQINS